MNIFIIDKDNNMSKVIKLLGSKNLPYLTQAIKMSANLVQNIWINRVGVATSPDGWKRRYAESIRIRKQTDKLSSIVEAGGKFTNFVETGIKRFDMKPGLLKGPHARVNEEGKPYNIIFLRKKVPGTKGSKKAKLPQNIYELAKKLRRFKVVGIGGKTPLISGKQLQERIYTRSKGLRGVGGIYEGLVKGGAKGHTGYGTFRVVSKASKGWWHPGVAASPVFEKLSREIKPKVKTLLQEGLMKDLESGMEFIKGKV